jgi:hypothetical protein
MAQLANCPQCDHELFVPGDVSPETRVRCPGCHAFFQLKEARSRDIEAVDVPEAAAEEPVDEFYTKQTVADLSSMATWDGEIKQESENDSVEALEPTGLHIAEQEDDDALDSASPEALDDSVGGIDANEVASSVESSEHSAHDYSTVDEAPPHSAELHVADIDDDSLDSDHTEKESPEAAAQRIDAWFRSAKTLADVPSPEGDGAEHPASQQDLDFMPTESTGSADTLDYHETDKPELREGFDLDVPPQAPQDVAVWDDSQHIDRLLAEIQDQPPEEYIPASVETAPEESAEHGNPPAAAADWMPDESYSMTSSGREPGRKKSLLRTMVMSAIGGLMGLALGYFVLLWLGIDLLGAAHYLPQAMLPAALKSPPKVASAPLPSTSSTEGADRATSELTAAPPADETKQAETSTADAAVEPAAFNAPSAAPVKSSEATPVQISGAPDFTSAQLAAAIQAGKDAEPNLVSGNLSDSRDVARRKGFSYSILADLAQKLTFTSPGLSVEDAKLQQEAEELFRKTLTGQHARDEIAQIVPKWIDSPNRKQGGVFFAGSIQTSQPKGTVVECNIEFGGQSLPVLLPASAAEQLQGSAAPVAVVGWIVDDPAKNVPGYTGATPQAVFANKLLPLE